jgi:steroid delta-isomerase-like uncharacterized protein
MSTEDNKALARRYWDAWKTGHMAILHDIASADHIFHDGAGREVRGTPGRTIPRFRTAFPDLHFAIEDIFADGDKVVVRWTAHGTHRGDIEIVGSAGTIPPTGKQVTFFGIDIFHIAGDKLVEGWRSWDRLGLLQQLGAVPTAG